MSNGDAATVKLGVMPPLTGLVGIYGDEIVNAARIACDEVNEAGGVLGRPLELIIEDDGSLPESAVAAAEKLVTLHRCAAIIGNLLSNSRIAVAYRVAEPHKIPYLNFSFYEGSILSHYFFHFAALPNQQIDRMIPYMLKKYGPRMFFAGNNYEWPRGSIDAAKRALLQAGGQVLGEEYTAIGVAVPDIDRLLDKVEAARPDVFVPYFAGIDQVNLLTRFTERGMKSRMAVVMGHYDELMASKLPANVREGFYSSNTYFMTLDTPGNRDYLARLARLPGITGIWPHGNGILTNFGEGTYLCVKAFAQAANVAGSLEPEALIKALGDIRITGPQGTVQMEPEAQHATVNTYLSRCNADGVFEIVEKFGAIFPVMPDRYRHERVDNRATLEEDIRLQSRMLEQMSEAVTLVDTNSGTIIYANGGAYRMFGYERGEMIGLPVARLNSPHVFSPEQVAEEITSIITRTGSWKGNIQNIRKDGTTLWSAATVNAFTHPVHGEVWMSVHQDITALKDSEEKLQQSEERLRQVITSTNDGIWDWNVETGEDYLSARWKDIFGYRDEELENRASTFFDLIHPDDRNAVAEAVKRHFEHNEPYRIEIRMRHKDGSYRWILTRGEAMRDASGRPVRMVGMIEDITERKRAELNLREREERLRAIMDNANTVIFLKDLQGRYLDINTRYEKLFHVSREQIRGKTDHEIFPAEVAEALIKNDQAVIESKRPIEIEEKVPQDDGLHTYLSVKFPLLDDAAEPYAVCGIATDITDRKRAEAEYKSILETSQDGFWMVSASDGRLIGVNPAACKMLGYACEQIAGRLTIADIEASQSPEQVAQNIKAIMESPTRSARFESTHRRADGQIINVDVSTQYLDVRGGIFVAFIRDITDRKRIEIYNKRLLDILDRSTDMISTADIEGRVLYMNAGGRALIGLPHDMDIRQIRIPDVHPEWVLQKVLEDGIPAAMRNGHWLGETALRHRDGHEFPVSQLIMFHPGQQGGQNYLSTIMRDISAQKQLETSLLAAKDQAEAASQAKSAFLANMSHEIRTPMNAVLGLTWLVLDSGGLTQQQREYLRKAYNSSRMMLGVLNDILDYSKLETGLLTMEHIPMRVEEILQDVSGLFGAQIEQKGLELFFDIEPRVPAVVMGDPLRLKQVLNNLVGNAIKFTEQGEIQIGVEIESMDGADVILRFAVRDTGIGINKEKIGSLFRPFVQADSSITRKYGGTGLGLAICQKLVSLMGGEISVSSIEEQGSVFTFTVKSRMLPSAAPDLQQIRGLRVLIVDDQEVSRLTLGRLLESWGVEAHIASSGEEALTRIEEAERGKCPFDAVLLDWRMPGMSGLDVAGRLGEMAKKKNIAHPALVVMVTAFSREELLEQAGTTPVGEVLSKPVVPSQLLEVLLGIRNPQAMRSEPGAEEWGDATSRFDGARVLLVEDNKLNQEVAAAFLQRRGVAVTLANNGSEAVELAQQEPFDLVLMDLHMPVMDGLEAARRILELSEGRSLPVVAMTAAVMPEDRKRCTEAGMVGFIAKPVDPGELMQCLHKWLKIYESKEGDIILTGENASIAEQLPNFEVAQALHRLDNDQALYARLLRGFADEQAGILARLDALLQARNTGEAATLLHTLKGVAANLGATNLARIAKQMEQEIKAGGPPLQSYPVFAAELEAVLASLKAWFESNKGEAIAPAQINRQELEDVLRALFPYIQSRELAPDELMQTLQRLEQTDLPGKPIAKLVRMIDQFDHDRALSAMIQLATQYKVEIAP